MDEWHSLHLGFTGLHSDVMVTLRALTLSRVQDVLCVIWRVNALVSSFTTSKVTPSIPLCERRCIEIYDEAYSAGIYLLLRSL